MMNNYNESLKRLVALGGTDEGFYVLALHSFIEGFSNGIRNTYSQYGTNFQDSIDELIAYLEKRNRLSETYRRALVRLAKEHALANRVRHEFRTVTKDEAEASTANFLIFCEAFKIEDPAMDQLRDSVQYFGRNKPGFEILRELEKAQRRLAEKEESEKTLLSKISKFDEMERTLAVLVANEAATKTELERLRQSAEEKGARADTLRQALFDAAKEKARLVSELQQYGDIEEYLHFLERFSNFTRTRLDYERSLMQLTSEQEAAVNAVRESGDYIVKGSAGTGKTLVLLHALERYLAERKEDLYRSSGAKVLLLTYTNTLAKYSKYLAHIVGQDQDSIVISTADSHILAAFKAAVPGAWIDFDLPGAVIKDYNATSFLSDEELATEIEDVIWGNLVTRDEYLDKHLLRRGMKQPLNATQRQLVWSIQEKLRTDLSASKRYSANLACARILEELETSTEYRVAFLCDRIFVDEGQDLSTARIRCLKALSKSGVMLAADDGQSIFRIGSPYLRAGLSAAGHVRHLHTNFRNTRQIHDFAENYLVPGNTAQESERANPGYREGPMPEIITAENEGELEKSLMEYVRLAIGRLGYDPENIGILAPAKWQLEKLGKRLGSAHYVAQNIKDEGFKFTTPGVIRLSTLHSSKGIEFPVVLLYLPSLVEMGNFDDKTNAAMQKNLIYVALTRAMDHVVIFTLDNCAEQPIRDLVTQAHGREKSAPEENQHE